MRSVILAAFLVVPSVASSQETASDTLLTVNHYLDWEQVADPQVSPAGSQILYTRRWVNKIEDRWDAGLWIMNADGSRNRFLVKGSSARWSPDGTRIAYFADGEPKGTQVFVRYGCRRRHVADHPRQRDSGELELVPGWPLARLRDAGEERDAVEDQHAGRAGRREVDSRAAHSGPAALPS